MKTIYIAEDEKNIREIYELALGSTYRVMSFPHAEGVLGAFDIEHPDLLLTDHNMGTGLTGHQLIDQVLERGYGGHVLMISGSIPKDFPHRALQKPLGLRELRSTIEGILQ